MTIEELEEKALQLRELHWMERIADYYREMLALIDKNLEYFTVRGIGYSCRGDEKVIDINANYPFPVKYIREGLADALGGLDRKITNLKSEIER